MITKVQDSISKYIKYLYIIAGIDSVSSASYSSIDTCTNIIDGNFMNVGSEFDESITDMTKRCKLSLSNFKNEIKKLKSNVASHNISSWSQLSLRYSPNMQIIPIIENQVKSITADNILADSIFESIKKDMKEFLNTFDFKDISIDLDDNLINPNDCWVLNNDKVVDIDSAIAYYTSLDKIILTVNEIDKVFSGYDELISNMDKCLSNVDSIRNDTYDKLKQHSETVKRDIVYQYRNGKYRAEEYSAASMELILFTSKVFIITEQILSLYLNIWNINLNELTRKMMMDKFNLNEAIAESDMKK